MLVGSAGAQAEPQPLTSPAVLQQVWVFLVCFSVQALLSPARTVSTDREWISGDWSLPTGLPERSRLLGPVGTRAPRSWLRYMLRRTGKGWVSSHVKDSGKASQTHSPLEGCRLRARKSRPGCPQGALSCPFLRLCKDILQGPAPWSRGPALKFEGQMGNSHLESCGPPLHRRTWRGSLLHIQA